MIHGGPDPVVLKIDLAEWGLPDAPETEVVIQRNPMTEGVFSSQTRYNKSWHPNDMSELFRNSSCMRLDDETLQGIALAVLKAYHAGIAQGREDKVDEFREAMGIERTGRKK